MFITKKKHHEILRQKVEAERNSARDRYQENIDSLRQQLKEARDLKAILEATAGIGVKMSNCLHVGGGLNYEVVFPDDVARFVPDYFGGQVIKQEATKVIEIDPDGNIRTGLTKRPPDPGVTYVLSQKTTNQ